MKHLDRTKQCAKCPWRCSTNAHTIPDGYDIEKHRALKNTIAVEGDFDFSNPLRLMSCHESPIENEQPCVGWLHHQLTIGNNIHLRLAVRDCDNINDITTFGDQHQSFEDTIPEE